MPSQIQNPPNAYYLVDSLRSTGYSFDAAVADIVDNSISAGAKHIDLYIPPTGERPYLAFVDDGCGMDRDELIRAMRFASFSKDEERKDSDLGRFGLGLKLASSSQCRRFTVLSKKNGKLSGMVWDLDSLMKEQSWVMGELSESECQKLPKFDELDVKNNGTMVLWENFDVLRNANSGKEYGPLVDKVDSACNHLWIDSYADDASPGAQHDDSSLFGKNEDGSYPDLWGSAGWKAGTGKCSLRSASCCRIRNRLCDEPQEG